MTFELIQQIMEPVLHNPWTLSFLTLFVIGYLLKEYSPINNKLIPWVLMIFGIVLGVILIEQTLQGALIGMVIAYVIMGFYDQIKGTFQTIFGSKEG